MTSTIYTAVPIGGGEKRVDIKCEIEETQHPKLSCRSGTMCVCSFCQYPSLVRPSMMFAYLNACERIEISTTRLVFFCSFIQVMMFSFPFDLETFQQKPHRPPRPVLCILSTRTFRLRLSTY